MDIQRLMIKVIKDNNVDVEGLNFPSVDPRILNDLGVVISE